MYVSIKQLISSEYVRVCVCVCVCVCSADCRAEVHSGLLADKGSMFLGNAGIYLRVHMIYNPEDQHPHVHRSENVKFRILHRTLH
jgi:hypothetical protein